MQDLENLLHSEKSSPCLPSDMSSRSPVEGSDDLTRASLPFQLFRLQSQLDALLKNEIYLLNVACKEENHDRPPFHSLRSSLLSSRDMSLSLEDQCYFVLITGRYWSELILSKERLIETETSLKSKELEIRALHDSIQMHKEEQARKNKKYVTELEQLVLKNEKLRANLKRALYMRNVGPISPIFLSSLSAFRSKKRPSIVERIQHGGHDWNHSYISTSLPISSMHPHASQTRYETNKEKLSVDAMHCHIQAEREPDEDENVNQARMRTRRTLRRDLKEEQEQGRLNGQGKKERISFKDVVKSKECYCHIPRRRACQVSREKNLSIKLARKVQQVQRCMSHWKDDMNEERERDRNQWTDRISEMKHLLAENETQWSMFRELFARFSSLNSNCPENVSQETRKKEAQGAILKYLGTEMGRSISSLFFLSDEERSEMTPSAVKDRTVIHAERDHLGSSNDCYSPFNHVRNETSSMKTEEFEFIRQKSEEEEEETRRNLSQKVMALECEIRMLELDLIQRTHDLILARNAIAHRSCPCQKTNVV